MASRGVENVKVIERFLNHGLTLFQGQRNIGFVRQFQDFLAQVAVPGPALEGTIPPGVPARQFLAQCNRINGIL